MTSAERLVRQVWAYHGGTGNPPPLIVTPQQYEDFKAAGLPEEMMQISRPLPTNPNHSS